MKYEKRKISELVPYENNPRINNDAVADVKESIRQCSYIAPIIVDENNVLLAGHTRLKALKELGEKSVSKKLLEYRKPGDRCISDISQRIRKKVSGFSNPINWDDEPVQTVTSGGSLFRGCDGLLMTDRDIINCQTFPQDYDFMDQNVQYVCGMSVPPVMMANVSLKVYEQWLKE